MWWSDDIVPRWVERSIAAALVTIVGFFPALVASLFVAVPLAPLIPDRLGAWLWWHPEGIYAITLSCALALAVVNDRLFFVRRER